MVFLAQKIRRDEELKKYKLIYLTDRTQLDSQLTTTLTGAQDETVLSADSSRELKELIKKDSSDLITSTIQKFLEFKNDELVAMNDSAKSNLIDEAHRTQYGIGSILNAVLSMHLKLHLLERSINFKKLR